MNDSVVGIIGGNGLMGQFLKTLFEEDGITVLISDLDTELSNQELARLSDIVIVSVPINQTIPVINEILPEMTEEKLFMDVTSIKCEPVSAMLESAADVIGTHPLFGPPLDKFDNQVIILTPARDKNGWLEQITTYFHGKKLKTKIATPEKHDEMMSLIQVLVHFNTIAIGISMSKLGLDLEETLDYPSSIYKMELGLIGRMFAQSSNLYGNILMKNPNTSQILLEHKATIEELTNLVLANNLQGFSELFEETADYFDSFKSILVAESNFLMAKLVEYNEKKRT